MIVSKQPEAFHVKTYLAEILLELCTKLLWFFENVTTVALKVVNQEQHGAFRTSLAECEALKLKHQLEVKDWIIFTTMDLYQ
jgi:hypothetical protein